MKTKFIVNSIVMILAAIILPFISSVRAADKKTNAQKSQAGELDYYSVQSEQGRTLRYRKTETGYILVLTPGQRIISSLKEFQKLQHIESGTVIGLGAVRNTSIGHFNFDTNSHDDTVFPDSHELVSLNCTLGTFSGAPQPHCHIAIGLGKEQGHVVVGGHLNEAEISIIGEFTILVSEAPLIRTFDEP